ncbi:MAG TPA: lysylphosphatidylglycerol synthase transmembrane domain-containing protein [Polyangiaceae bacterium]|nr:lysylphosphatidylglycerol synthase transmembrane domain-containing protein [Polyangiaceae bacterium]
MQPSDPGRNERQPAGEAEQRASSALHRLLPRALISLLIAGGFVWALKRGGLPLSPPEAALPFLKWWAIPAFLVTNLVSMAMRTHRMVYLLRPIRRDVSAAGVVGIGLIGYAAIFFAPLRLGEVVRPYLLARHERVKFGQGLGVVAAERIIDGLMTVLLTAAGLAFSRHITPLPDHIGDLPIPISLVPRVLRSATVLFGLAFVGMAVLYATRAFAIDFLRRIFGVISKPLATSLAQIAERVLDGFAFLPSFRHSGMFVFESVVAWGMTTATQWVLLQGVGLEASFWIACVTTGLIALGSLLPAGPGFFGPYQIATYTSLAMFFVPALVTTQGALYVFGSYACHVALNLSYALVGFLLLRRSSSQPT